MFVRGPGPPPILGPLFIGYGVSMLLYAADRGRKYLRFIIPGSQEAYRLWLVGFGIIIYGCLLSAILIATALHRMKGTWYG
jgi:hypothetical protein